MRLIAAVSVLVTACGGAPPKLYPAGTERDEGHGELARASSKFMTSDEGDNDLFTSSARPVPQNRDVDPYDYQYGYGGMGYGGMGYGGGTYGTYITPSWSYPSSNRGQHYSPTPGLTGSIEGAIRWRGAVPPKIGTSCGAMPALPVASDGGLADVLVYIDHVSVGRPIPIENHVSNVGGTVVKRGCAFLPAVQIVTPLPAALSIHGDGKRGKVRVAPPLGAPKSSEIEEGGLITMQVAAGLTKVDADDGTFAAAWVLAIDTPYYAITDDRGRFRLDELASGTYEVTIWQAPIATVSNGTVSYGAPIIVRRTVTVDQKRPTRLDVTLGR
jgi:hypothetical protein